MRRWALAAAGVLAAAGALAGGARAQSSTASVDLTVRSCDLDDAALRRLFYLELDTIARGAQLSVLPGARVSLSCRGASLRAIVIRRDGAQRVERELSVGVRRGAERLAALAATELLVTVWADSPDIDAASRSALVGEPVAAPPSWQVTTSVFVLVGEAGVGLETGAGARVQVDGRGRLGFGADVRAQRGNARASLGMVNVDSLSLSPTVHMGGTWRALALRAAVGARLALVTMSGEPDDPMTAMGSSTSALAGGPMARLSAAYLVGDDLSVELAAEPALNVLSLGGTVNGREEVALSRASISSQLAVGWRW